MGLRIGWAAGLLAAAWPVAWAAEPTTPIPVDKVETAKVRLVVLDVVVLDREGRTVPGLTRDDFELVVVGKPVAVDTLDVDCPGGAAEEPRAVSHARKRPPPEAAGAGRRIVLALDYLHLGQLQRVNVLEQAKEMVEQGGAAGEEFMVVALNGGLRVEQQFSADREQVRRALHRMEYDISLWQPSFQHLDESGFVDGLTTLFDVLGQVPGSKAVVLYSAMLDLPLDRQFLEIAATAAGARCTIYPVDAFGLRTLEQDRAVRAGGT